MPCSTNFSMTVETVFFFLLFFFYIRFSQSNNFSYKSFNSVLYVLSVIFAYHCSYGAGTISFLHIEITVIQQQNTYICMIQQFISNE